MSEHLKVQNPHSKGVTICLGIFGKLEQISKEALFPAVGVNAIEHNLHIYECEQKFIQGYVLYVGRSIF
jgi:hypothetical protein